MAGRVVAVLGTRYPDLGVEERVLRPLGAVLRRGAGTSREEIIEVARDAEVVLCGSGPRFDRATLAELALTGIVRYGVGTDSIDLAAAREMGLRVARVSDYGTEAVSFHAVTLALAAIRRLVPANRRTHAGEWGFGALRPLHAPSATTVGVVGYGRIGRAAARMFAGLGFAVLAYDPYINVAAVVGESPQTLDRADDGPPGAASGGIQDNPPGAASGGIQAAGTLEALLARSDVVTLHAPGGTDPVLDRARLASLRPGSILVNTARGSLIDEDALVDLMISTGRPAVAALDVFAAEPPDLARFAPLGDRLIATPHMAWYTEESERDLREKAAEEAARILRGEPLRDPVVEPDVRGG